MEKFNQICERYLNASTSPSKPSKTKKLNPRSNHQLSNDLPPEIPGSPPCRLISCRKYLIQIYAIINI